jgi:hypothetical protein
MIKPLFLKLTKLEGVKAAIPTEKCISVILPAYNEALQIEKSVLAVEAALSSLSGSYEIIVSEDGSTDGTDSIVSKMSKFNPNVFLLHSPTRLGKGKAIKNAIATSKGKIIIFMDVDLATSLECLPKLLRSVKEKGGLAIGSRHVKGSCVHRRISRTLFSLTYNTFVRLLFFDGIHDHQCGFKMMDRKVAKTILKASKSDGYFFDTEMIVCCKRLGLPVIEFAVEWTEKTKKGNSKVNPIHDAKKIGLDLLAFRFNSNVKNPTVKHIPFKGLSKEQKKR